MTALDGTRPEPLDVAILAGGDNTRLEDLSGTIFKPFLPLRRASLVARHIARCTLGGATRVLVVADTADPLAVRIVADAAAGYDGDTTVATAEHRGDPAEKIVHAHATLGRPEPLVVILGDSFARYDPRELVAACRRRGVDSAMAVASYRLPFGVVEADAGLVSRFDEKPDTGFLVNTGHLALGAQALALLAERHALGDVLATLAERRQLTTVELPPDFVTVDSLGDIAAALRSPLLIAEADPL